MKRGRGRGRKAKAEQAAVEDPTKRQLSLDFTPEEAMEALFEAGDLSARIGRLDAMALDARREARKLKGALSEILRQAAAKKRTETVDTEERVDLDHRVVTIHRKDTGEQVAEREMTSAEVEAGVVLNPAQAAHALKAVHQAGGGNGAVHDVTEVDEEDYDDGGAEAAAISGDAGDAAAIHEVTR